MLQLAFEPIGETRLDEHRIGTRALRTADLRGKRFCRQHDDAHAAGLGISSNQLAELVAVDVWQTDFSDDERRPAFEHLHEAFASVVGFVDAPAGSHQGVSVQASRVEIAVDEQN